MNIQLTKGYRLGQQPQEPQRPIQAPQQSQYQPPQNNIAESFDEALAREPQKGIGVLGRLGTAAVRGLEAPGRLLNAGLQYLGGPSLGGNTRPEDTLSNDVGRLLGAQNPEELKPRSPLETFAQRTLEKAPIGALTGGLPAVITGGVGSAAHGLSKGVGLPDWLADLAEAGTEAATGVYTGRLPTTRTAQNQAYESTRALSKPVRKTPLKPIKAAVKSVKDKLRTEVNPNIKEKINGILDTVKDNLDRKTIQPKTFMDLRRKTNNFIKTLPEDAQHYGWEVTKGINDFFGQYAAENPKFYEGLTKADKLTSAIHIESIIDKGIDALANKLSGKDFQTIKNQWIDLGRGGLKYVGMAGSIPEKFARNFYNNNAFREHTFDLIKKFGQGSSATILKSLEDMTNSLKEKSPRHRNASSTRHPSTHLTMTRGRKIK